MIKCVSGDFFDHDADIRINTVNCVGVMGKGVALEFKKRYPDMFKSYVIACKNNEIAPGKPHLWEDYNLFSHCTIVNLPTKLHWKDSSEYEYIEKDLIWLRDFLMDKDSVVTLPALGCGHGGLDWSIVKARIYYYLEDVRAEILLFEPISSNKKLGEPHYGLPAGAGNITVVDPKHPDYPIRKNTSNPKTLYCTGNTALLKQKWISILCSNAPSNRELSAIERIAEEINSQGRVIVLPLNNKKLLNLSITLLSQGINVVLVLPYGICSFKHGDLLEKYKNNYVILSYEVPTQDFTRFSYIDSLKYRSEMGQVILYASENINDIQRDIKYLGGFSKLFYINYWSEGRPEFSNIGAQKIGIDPKSGKPNVAVLLQRLESHQD